MEKTPEHKNKFFYVIAPDIFFNKNNYNICSWKSYENKSFNQFFHTGHRKECKS